MTAPISHTAPLTSEQAERLRALLTERGWKFVEKPHTLFAAEKPGEKVNVAVYTKGPKVLVQGKGTAEFVQFLLEPEILGRAELGYAEELQPEMFSPHIGIDESGKGDFFGPLVVAAVYVDRDIARAFRAAGIQDSKAIGSDARIRQLAEVVRTTPGVAYEIFSLIPERYNAAYAKFKNLNRLLAWGHAKVLEAVLEQRPDCPRALSDQFANPALLKRALQTRGKAIELESRTKAESDPAVAAASILARERFVDWMDRSSKAYGEKIPRGAGVEVSRVAKNLVKERGAPFLTRAAKTHFRTAHEAAPDYFAAPPPRQEWRKPSP
ncbi:MAG: ribonuclease HIII [Verrucomicrobia bacterium]|nr:ribonuclease HIII [Verrucomicrobiota bacterium]